MLRRRPTAPLALLLGLAAAAGLLWSFSALGSTAWALAVLGVLFGFGTLVQRAFRVELDLGELLGLGTVAWIFVTGLLLAVDAASRLPLLGLVGVGLVAAA